MRENIIVCRMVLWTFWKNLCCTVVSLEKSFPNYIFVCVIFNKQIMIPGIDVLLLTYTVGIISVSSFLSEQNVLSKNKFYLIFTIGQ